MTRISVLLITLWIPFSIAAQTPTSDLEKEVREAVELMDRNLPGAAITLWDKVIKQAPDYIPYKYERVICYVMEKKYAEAIALLKPFYSDSSLLERGYQLIGNCYDYLDQTDSSMYYYTLGIERYPASGRLHYEMGAAELLRANKEAALSWWRKGTLAEPSFATNYYWLAKTYAETSNKLYSAFYCEAFLNIESATTRTREISNLCFRVWRYAIRPGHPDDPINFCDDEQLSLPGPSGLKSMNFFTAFEYSVALAAFHLAPDTGTRENLTIRELVDIRTRLIRGWKGAGYDTLYSNDVMTWNMKLKEENRLSEYLWWLFSYGDAKEMNDYFKANEQRYDTFLAWFGDNSWNPKKKWCMTKDCN